MGSSFYDFVKSNNFTFINILSETMIGNLSNSFNHFIHGFKLKSYEFIKYKSKKELKNITIKILQNKNKSMNKDLLKFKALEEGTFTQET